ncbi:murein hydrolase activator EnvC family protein [Altibacter sp. HG106]|uniref:murein hydrolase activator EnvC family protein n=1 Tax=Altibacter sp. HG106 TaxID=3023937 RepID=UPI0023509B63|nr:peptidoglycan DD-metalloendopeptidase family protein [Altibacter sp. HG106]MDC7995039.1 peptidoglycan DD-metalloendopeptidase family protein [Altibacter sp. HG106]
MQLSRTFILLLFCLLVQSSWSQSKKQQELEAQRQAVLEEIRQINSLLFKTRGEKKSVLSEVEDLDQRISATENLIRITNRQANLLSREINDNIEKVASLREELEVLKEDYAGMIQRSYKSKSQQSRIMFLLSSESFLQAYKRLQYMKQYTKHRKEQGENIQKKTEEVQELNKQLIQQKKDKDQLVAANRETQKQLAQEKAQQQSLIASLKQDEGKFAAQIRSKQQEADRLDREIEAIIRAAIAASNKASGNEASANPREKAEVFALTAEAKALAANFTSNKGSLPWPVEKGVVVRAYGNKQHPQLPNVTTFSSGVEIATESGTKARAVFDGEVFQIQQLKGANKAVYIRHGSYITIYNNLASVSVTKGQKVTTKQEIGTIFTNPLSSKTILKFLVYQNSTRMNPADWIYKM